MQKTFACAVTALLALSALARSAPTLRPRQEIVYQDRQDPLYQAIQASVVRAADSNSTCDRSQLRFQTVLPTALFNDSLDFYYYIHQYPIKLREKDLSDIAHFWDNSSLSTSLTQNGTNTVVQFRALRYHDDGQPYLPAEYDVLGPWPLGKNQTGYYLAFQLYNKAADAFYASETPFSPPSDCIARWNDPKNANRRENQIFNGALSPLHGNSWASAVVAAALLGAGVMILL